MNDNFVIYYKDNAFHSVDGAIDINIMKALSERDMSITEIADRLLRSPSTITTHLVELKDSGLLKSKLSERDSRAKIYALDDCEMVAESNAENATDEVFLKLVDKLVSKEIPFMEGVFMLFIHGLGCNSIDVTSSINILARRLGRIMASRVPNGDFFTLLNNIKDLFSEIGVGEMTFALSNCITMNIFSSETRNFDDSSLIKEICSNLIKTALECASGKKMECEAPHIDGSCVTLKIRFAGL